MPSSESSPLSLEFRALTPQRWRDLENLFGQSGACGGSWCMWWKLKRSECVQGKGQKNKKAFKKLVDSGEGPGLIAYSADQPGGWGALAPPDQYDPVGRSR